MSGNTVTALVEALRVAVANDAAANEIDLGNKREAIETAASIGAEVAVAILKGAGIKVNGEGTVEGLLAAALIEAA